MGSASAFCLCFDGQTDKQTGRQMGRQADGQAGRQADDETGRQTREKLRRGLVWFGLDRVGSVYRTDLFVGGFVSFGPDQSLSESLQKNIVKQEDV